MASFWFVSAPLYSHTDWGGFLRTSKALQSRGHDVLWMSETPLKAALEQQDIPFRAIRKTGWLWPPPSPPDLTQMPPPEAVKLRYTRALDTWLSPDWIAEAVRAMLEAADETGAPDAVVSEPFLSAAAIAAEKLARPFIVCGWPAQQTLDADQLFPVQRDLSSESQRRIQRLCDEFGISGVNFSKGTASSIQSPTLHITYFTPEWYLSDMPSILPQTQFVGGQPASLTIPPPSWLLDIPADKPLGLVTLGTVFTGDLGFYSWAAQALARAGLIPIATVGWHPIPPDKKAELKRALPAGTRLLTWAPYDHVLPRSKIIIHHGGMGTTHSAVIHGLPQIVVPHAADQRLQARRVSEAKVGLHLTAHDVRQGQLRDGVKALMQADWVQNNARKLARRMAALGGVERAADLIVEGLG